MNKLILLIIALALTPTSYAAQTIDRDKYNYYCRDNDIFKSRCENLEKGDALKSLIALFVVLYCDKDELIIDSGLNQFKEPIYDCIYNGREIKNSAKLRKN